MLIVLEPVQELYRDALKMEISNVKKGFDLVIVKASKVYIGSVTKVKIMLFS